MSDIDTELDMIFEMIKQGGEDWLWGEDNLKEAKERLKKLMLKERKAENEKPLKLLKNFKPKPGEKTAFSFGSAGAGMVYKEWQNFHEDRISELDKQIEEGA